MVYSDKIRFIDAGVQDMSRPKGRPSKNTWKIRLIKKSLGVLQHISPRKTSKLIWQQFSKTGRAKFTPNQEELLEQATLGKMNYLSHDIITYRWGKSSHPKVLLAHGWNSKTIDFRRMISSLVENGYCVEGVDMKGHGNSEGTHTTVPEFRDILKNYYTEHGPSETVIGYSMGGLAVGIMLSELSAGFQPKSLFIIASPSHTRYFFRDMIDSLGYTDKIYNTMCKMVEETYHQPIDYFDLREKFLQLSGIDIHLIYDENDATIEMKRGHAILEAFPNASFVHTKGLGHYKIISYDGVIDYMLENINKKSAVLIG